MNLLHILAAGVNGAANGFVDVFKRGTSTYAQVFTTYDGQGASTPSGSLTLDANGSRTLFVNEEVDLVVKDASGNILKSLDPMLTATDVEYIGPSFTGVDYTTGQSAVNKPITLQDILNLWVTNAGATDWKVNPGSGAVTLPTALSALAGLFFNVKAVVYGAKGDGATDDGSAIAAAIAAAVAAGGGVVYFPSGVYRIATTISLSAKISFLGAGPGASTIQMDHATNDSVSVAVGTANVPILVQGLSFTCAQANTGKLLKIAAGTTVHVRDCLFGSSNGFANGKCLSYDNAATRLSVTNCVFILGSAGVTYGIFLENAAATAIILGCRFVGPVTFNGSCIFQNFAGDMICVGNIFDMSGTSGGSGNVVLAAANAGLVIAGNRFIAPTGGSPTPIAYTGGIGGSFAGLNSITQSAFWTAAGPPSVAAATTSHEGSDDVNRNVRVYHISTDASPITVDPTIYGCAEVRRTTNGNQTINGVTPTSAGQMFTLAINNDNAALSGTITLGTAFKGLVPFVITANTVKSITFRSYENMAAGGASATKYWGFVGTTADVAP